MRVVRAPVPATPRRLPQRFCSAAHRVAFWSALRRWAERAVAAGALTVDHVKSGDPVACTLLPSGDSPVPVPEPQKRTPVAPAERPGEAAELLYALLAVQSEGWHALAAAMSQELFDRLKRWHAARLARHRAHVRSCAR
jgi:hypothetical protein